MTIPLLLVAGAAIAILGVAWWVRRHQAPIDGYEDREYRDPPVSWPPD